jgi:hypothetical protein
LLLWRWLGLLLKRFWRIVCESQTRSLSRVTTDRNRGDRRARGASCPAWEKACSSPTKSYDGTSSPRFTCQPPKQRLPRMKRHEAWFAFVFNILDFMAGGGWRFSCQLRERNFCLPSSCHPTSLGSAPCVNHTIDLDWMDGQGWQAGVLKSSRGIGGMSSRGRPAPHEDHLLRSTVHRSR